MSSVQPRSEAPGEPSLRSTTSTWRSDRMSSATGLDPAIEYHVVNSLGWPGLRPLQAAAVDPVRAGDDCVLLAPTAGGKTEAATFPLLSAMTANGWTGTSVLYVAPLRALLNNLQPRLSSYASW